MSLLQKENIAFPLNIYRYKFDTNFTDELYNFSKIHQYDDRKVFKESWQDWIIENSHIVEQEIARLTNLGYDGDILDKMFKSARYYFRKKNTEKKKPIKRRNYISLDKEFLEIIDNHIKSSKTYLLKPSIGFTKFCEKNEEYINAQINTIAMSSSSLDIKEIKNKIKKTYKNRYFVFVNTLNNKVN